MTKTETLTIATEKRTLKSKSAVKEPNVVGLSIVRIFAICLIYLGYRQSDVIQSYINILWEWLRHKWWYETVYNETFLVELYSVPVNSFYRIPHWLGFAQKYRIESGGAYDMYNYKDMMVEALEYAWPLMILDTFHVKHYAGVSDEIISEKRKCWIQTTRALPVDPPLLADMMRHLIVAIIIYDACFFLQHLIFHKNATLYRLFHSRHHQHGPVTVRVTNTLHTVERIFLVLSANFGLKIQGAHPLTRTLFIFIFVLMLIDNHCGYDFPYSYEKILPRGLIGGSRRHFGHHEHGSRNYQPFFTYLDNLWQYVEKKRNQA